MTPTPYALTFFQEREQSAYLAYDKFIKQLVDNWTLEGWHEARDLHNNWLDTRIDLQRADAATPCQHIAAERHDQAQRCGWCWTISTYVRLTTPKENDTNE